MNAPADSTHISRFATVSAADLLPVDAPETSPADDDKVCWIEVRQSTYSPDQQVELLHLQAEADALLLHLQTVQQRRHTGAASLVG
jgi:hypothetical protein